MSREKPVKNERYIWEPGNNLGRVFMSVRSVLIGGARPRVTFNCTTGRDHWTKTMKFPLIHTIQECEWTEEDVRNEARRPDGTDSSGQAIRPAEEHLHGVSEAAVDLRPGPLRRV